MENNQQSKLKAKRAKVDSDEESLIDTHKLTNKERAKIHRDRKKKYYQELEQKVEKLEQEIKELKEKYEISISSRCSSCCYFVPDDISKDMQRYSTSIVRCPKHELIEDEKFLINDLPNFIEQNPDQFRMTFYDRIKEKTGTYGTERIQCIKSLFKEILEHIVPHDTKLFMLMNKQCSASQLVKLGLMKNKVNRKKYKFYKETTDKDFLDVILKYDFSDTLLKFWRKSAPAYYSILNSFKEEIHELIRVRNRIFNLLKTMNDFLINCDIYKDLNQIDLCSLSRACQELKGTKLFDPSSLWSLPQKTTAEDEYKDDELETE